MSAGSSGPMAGGGIAGARREAVEGRHAGQRPHARAQEAGDPLDLRKRDEQSRLRVVEDLHLARSVFLEPAGPRRRIDRNRDGTGQENAEERREKPGLGAQHERDGLALRHAARAEAGGHVGGPRPQLTIRDALLALVVEAEDDVHATGIGLGVPAQDVDQRARRVRRRRPGRHRGDCLHDGGARWLASGDHGG